MPSPKESSGRADLLRLSRLLRLLLAGGLVFLFVLGAAAWWRLSRGPIPLQTLSGVFIGVSKNPRGDRTRRIAGRTE